MEVNLIALELAFFFHPTSISVIHGLTVCYYNDSLMSVTQQRCHPLTIAVLQNHQEDYYFFFFDSTMITINIQAHTKTANTSWQIKAPQSTQITI